MQSPSSRAFSLASPGIFSLTVTKSTATPLARKEKMALIARTQNRPKMKPQSGPPRLRQEEPYRALAG